VLELNYYPPGTPYGTEYAAGDGQDHLAVSRVDGVK
jgi:hypothetical protein